MDNIITVVAQQEFPVSISQLNASIRQDSIKRDLDIVERNGKFRIHPDTTGIVEININLGDTTETKKLRVKDFLVEGSLGNFCTNCDEKIESNAFKVQKGIIATIMCCGFDARCLVLGFETIRISKRNEVERVTNRGGEFEEETINIIDKAKSGDIYIFREIKYKCDSPKRLDDMIFEIK